MTGIMNAVIPYWRIIIGQLDPAYLPLIVIPLGFLTSWGVSKGCRVFWENGCSLIRRVIRWVMWYGSIGVLAFAFLKIVGDVVSKQARGWIITKQTTYLEAKNYVQQAWSWVQGNHYATVVSVAALTLAYSYANSQQKVVDDQGINCNNNDENRRSRMSDIEDIVLKAISGNSYLARAQRALVKSVQLPTISVGSKGSSTNSMESTVSGITHLTDKVADDFLTLARSLQTDVQQLKEVVVALSLRIREAEAHKLIEKETEKGKQEVAEIFAIVAQESRKRNRRVLPDRLDDGLTENEVRSLIGKTKREVMQEFREEMLKEAAEKREPDGLTESEAKLGMKSLSELDIEWRKKRNLPVKDFHDRGIGVLTKEQTQLKRKEIIELIRGRRNDDFVARMKEKGRTVMRCPDCNQQFLVERGHRCYTAQWKVQAPKGPIPVERKIVVSQTGGGAVQVKPVTRVNIDKLDGELKRLHNYKLIHQKVEDIANRESDQVGERQEREGKTNEEIELVETSAHGIMNEAHVNQVEAQFQALMDDTRNDKRIESAVPFREGVRPHESPTRC